MPIATPDVYAEMLDAAKNGRFAYPAINVTSSQTLNGALRGFADAYRTYDVVARRVPAYGYVYPFVELLLGAAYVTGFQPLVGGSGLGQRKRRVDVHTRASATNELVRAEEVVAGAEQVCARARVGQHGQPGVQAGVGAHGDGDQSE